MPLASTQGILPDRAFSAAKTLVLTAGVAVLSAVVLLVLFYVMSSPTFGWTGARLKHGFSFWVPLGHTHLMLCIFCAVHH